MNELCRVALEVQFECEKRHWKFCFIGGLAVQHWGEPRFTRDVDLTLLTGFGKEEDYIDPLLETFAPRMEGCRDFALQNRVLLLKSSEGIGIDIALGALPFEEHAVNRSQLIEVERNRGHTNCLKKRGEARTRSGIRHRNRCAMSDLRQRGRSHHVVRGRRVTPLRPFWLSGG